MLFTSLESIDKYEFLTGKEVLSLQCSKTPKQEKFISSGYETNDLVDELGDNIRIVEKFSNKNPVYVKEASDQNMLHNS